MHSEGISFIHACMQVGFVQIYGRLYIYIYIVRACKFIKFAACKRMHFPKTRILAYPSIYLMHAFVSTSNPMVAAGWDKLRRVVGKQSPRSSLQTARYLLSGHANTYTHTHTPLQDLNACTHSPWYAIQKQLVCLPQHQHHHHRRCAVAHRFGRQQHNAIAPFNNTRGISRPIWGRTAEETATFSPWHIYAQCAPVPNTSSRYPKLTWLEEK